jgi:hypothetical protein
MGNRIDSELAGLYRYLGRILQKIPHFRQNPEALRIIPFPLHAVGVGSKPCKGLTKPQMKTQLKSFAALILLVSACITFAFTVYSIRQSEKERLHAQHNQSTNTFTPKSLQK